MEGNQQIQRLSTSVLQFDSENPRLPNTVNGSNEEEVINWMILNENVLELMASIAEKGFFPAEPLLVARNKTNSTKYDVIEGNRRLTAVKLLLNPNLTTTRNRAISEIIAEGKMIHTLNQLPVIIFDSSEDIQQYLGYRHITGVQPWDSLAKARYLKKMFDSIESDNLQEVYKTLAKTIGSRADHVKLLLTGLNVYQQIEDHDFYHIGGLNEKSLKFGVLYTAINHSNIADFIGVDMDKNIPVADLKHDELGELTKWLFEKREDGSTRIGESRNLRLLNKVVINHKALEYFRKEKSLNDSVLLTDEPDEIFRHSIVESLNKLQTARDYLHLIHNFDNNYEDTLKEIWQMSKTMLSTINAKKMELDDE